MTPIYKDPIAMALLLCCALMAAFCARGIYLLGGLH